ncbi:MAG: leucine-rich repeat domain-containing protein [Bacteroidales bacterium]|nr:leucine-rich repeat domain-containing protein [Bacteroidales bacterium]
MRLNARYLVVVILGLYSIACHAYQPPADSLRQAQLDSLLRLGVGRLSVAEPSNDGIRAHIKRQPMLDYGEQFAKYDSPPKVRPPWAAGRLGASYVQRGLNAINAMRYIAGLEPNVRLDASQADACQAAALACAAGRSAKPSAMPSGMDKMLWQRGLRALEGALVAESSEQLDRAVVFDLLRDARKAELSDVLRRRELLNPALSAVAVGQVGKYCVLKPVKEQPQGPFMVPWPAQRTPIDYFDVNTPLSIIFSDGYDIKGNVVVVMVRKHDGRVWRFGRLLPKADGHYSTSTTASGGSSRCIVWRPNGIDQYRPGDLFAIHVSGVKYQGIELPPIEYTVAFFSLFTVLSNGYLHVMEPVSAIGSGAYKANADLTSVDIDRSVVSIGTAAFASCTKLERVNLPAALPTIPPELFKGCIALKGISLPQTAISVGDEAFAGCAALASLGMSYKLESIGRAAFSGCTSLGAVELPESLREIGPNAFAGCAALAQLSIPKGVRRIGPSAFSGCAGLRRLSIEGGGEPASLELCAHAFQGCPALDSVSLPGAMQALEEQVFDGCSTLRVVRIGEGTTRIADNAFGRAPVERIYIPASVQQIGRVSAIPTTATIYCPAGSYAEHWAKGLFRKYVIVN